jgi:hypothetical protein
VNGAPLAALDSSGGGSHHAANHSKVEVADKAER